MFTLLKFFFFSPHGAEIAPVLSHPYSTTSVIRLVWTNATNNIGPVQYDVYRNGVLFAADETSPYDAAGSQGQVYTFMIRATDNVDSVDSNEIDAALEFDGSVSGSGQRSWVF